MENLFKNNHLLAFWGGDLSPHIHLFDLVAHQTGVYPKVVVAISQQGMSLCLSYFIEKTDGLDFANFDKQAFQRQDYLWEQNCLECFIEFNRQADYLEINSSPTGAYNVYSFDDYRSPSHLPPRKDNKTDISYASTGNTHQDWHIRHMLVGLNHHFRAIKKNQMQSTLTKIHPTAILYQDGTPIYYAIRHTTPPDFHNKAFWHSL